MDKFPTPQPEIQTIISVSYQTWITECISNFLATFSPSPKNHHGKLSGPQAIPVSLRVSENPPSVQIVQSPMGGQKAGFQRIKKLASEENGFFMPELVVAHAKDLTRELVMVTLQDESLNAIIDNSLLDPQKIAEVLATLRIDHPHFFVVFQRYIMGIELEDGLKVPYKVVTEEDEETLKYLEELPRKFG